VEREPAARERGAPTIGVGPLRRAVTELIGAAASPRSRPAPATFAARCACFVLTDALPERHDSMRGEGSFAAALNALECLHEVGFEPKALVTLTTHSLPDLEELLRLLFERGIRQVSLNRLRLIGRARRNAGWQVDAEEVHVALRRAWARCYRDGPAPPEPPEPVPHINCGVGQFLTIFPNGDFYPCHVLTQREFRCGNVREEGLFTLCSRTGPLDRLARLDLTEISPSDHSLARPPRDLCAGEVYAATRSSPVWVDVLPNRLTRGEIHHEHPNDVQEQDRHRKGHHPETHTSRRGAHGE
jgi:hypothetical protein